MLVKFRVGNFLSFGTVQEFSMISDGKDRKDDRIFTNTEPPVLRNSFIFGKNVIGNDLFRAMEVSRECVCGIWSGASLTQSRIVQKSGALENRRLGKDGKEEPAYFEYWVLTEQGLFSYGFEIVIGQGKITTEWMVRHNADGSENTVFRTESGKFAVEPPERTLARQAESRMGEDDLFLVSACGFIERCESPRFDEPHEGSRTKTDDWLLDIRGWFNAGLLIATDNRYGEEITVKDGTIERVSKKIASYGTGVKGIKLKKLTADEQYQANWDIHNGVLHPWYMSDDESQLGLVNRRLVRIKKQGRGLRCERGRDRTLPSGTFPELLGGIRRHQKAPFDPVPAG